MTVLGEAAGPTLLRSAVCASEAGGGALPGPRPPRTKRRGSRTAAPIWPRLGAQPAPPSYPSALAGGRRLAPRPALAARYSRGGAAPARVFRRLAASRKAEEPRVRHWSRGHRQ